MMLPKLKLLTFRGFKFPPSYDNIYALRNYQRYAEEQRLSNKKMGKLMRSNDYNATMFYNNMENDGFSHVDKSNYNILCNNDEPIDVNKVKAGDEVAKNNYPFFLNDKLFYNYLAHKLMNKENKRKHISHDFFYHLNKFHINVINNHFNECFLKLTKTSKIFFAVVSSFSVLLTFFLVVSSNYLEYNIILKYHIKFHSLLFSFFPSYYLGLQVGSYYFTNNFHYMYAFLFLVSSIISMCMADYDIWGSYYFLSLNYLAFIVINYYNMYLNRFPNYIFQKINRIFFFSLMSNYLAVNKGKYIEKNIHLLRDETDDANRFKLFKVLPYFL
ncbi:hypothetical protein, conserved [Plasmodium gonderi]|uniref:Uncharacterized protein n=1 Tax=Plasmodium gonderi TaxID=77519 RepID=A0A1Y1JGY2_PLAGO|nr:hypothetical protein, conserved [Plasmodium gonderi]GAW81776.1 hypothetical protein, conserved [Plasmodium gonderi]